MITVDLRIQCDKCGAKSKVRAADDSVNAIDDLRNRGVQDGFGHKLEGLRFVDVCSECRDK